MDPELEALLKAWEAYLETDAARARGGAVAGDLRVQSGGSRTVAQNPSRVRSSRRQKVLSPVATLDRAWLPQTPAEGLKPLPALISWKIKICAD